MRTVTLGASHLEVTPIAYGTWQFGGDWGPVDEQAAVAAISGARSAGINFFDTAQAYGFGRSERLLGRALKAELRSARDSVVIATKGGLRMDGDRLVRDASPAWLRKGVEVSLEALGTDYIDLYQVHWPDPATPIGETAAALAELVREGLIRHVGVSNYTTEQITEFAAVLPAETVQPPSPEPPRSAPMTGARTARPSPGQGSGAICKSSRRWAASPRTAAPPSPSSRWPGCWPTRPSRSPSSARAPRPTSWKASAPSTSP